MTKSLTDQINTLIELQKIDTQIYELNVQLELIPGKQHVYNKKINVAKDDLQHGEATLKEIQLKQKERENDVLEKETLIKRYQTQQAQVKTNQEYTALTEEIRNAGADKSLAEDEALKLMEEVEVAKKTVEELKAALKAAEDAATSENVVLMAEKKELEDRINELDLQRNQYLSCVEEELLQQYDKILKKREGIAVVPLEGHSCGGCSLNFPPQTVNLIKLKEEVIFCESCSRIIYEPTEESAAS